MNKSDIKFVFFGNEPLLEEVLSELAKKNLVPALTISAPLSNEMLKQLEASEWDLFIVASYGSILQKNILDMPKKGVLNIHPSLLPRLRGASPIRSAILNDEKETGVSIMVLDEELDHGPILAQRKIVVDEWPPHGRDLDALLAHEGGRLLAEIVPLWMRDEIEARPQNHDIATYCERFKKEDGLLDLAADPYQNLLKIRAYEGWPGTYAFFERPSTRSGQANGKRIRVQILDAHLEGTVLVIDRVKPEGKREMGYEEFLRSGARPVS